MPYKDTAKEFGLSTTAWPTHLEKIYSGVPEILNILAKKYKLGIIANQDIGTEKRLCEYGIHKYFDIIVSSAEEGISKPDTKIFEIALEKADCDPCSSYMIGDRLDNDIVPAEKLGMKTIWVRQGIFKNGNLEMIDYRPDHIVEGIVEIINLFE